MRAKVFDEWVENKLETNKNSIVLHIGCGLDSRILRVKNSFLLWYDVDFPEVISQRKKYYSEGEYYKMIEGDASKPEWIENLKNSENAVIILEGISMYMTNSEVAELFKALQKKYKQVNILMDVYTVFGTKASKYKNPINSVGVNKVYGIDNPEVVLKGNNMKFVNEYTMTPKKLVSQLKGFEKFFFDKVFEGKITKKIYRLFEYKV